MTLKDDILALREQGLGYKKIAQQLGCAVSTSRYHSSSKAKIANASRQRGRRSKLRQMVEEIKTGVPCHDCDQLYPPFVLDFDHRPDELKLFNIATSLKDRTEAEIYVEIAKCDIVCANCHRFRTWFRLVEK